MMYEPEIYKHSRQEAERERAASRKRMAALRAEYAGDRWKTTWAVLAAVGIAAAVGYLIMTAAW